MVALYVSVFLFFFKQKTAYEMRISDWSSDVCSSDLPDGRVRISFHPQCFLEQGHFAGSDEARADALVELANDPAVDALWIARGGWGAARIVDMVLPRLNRAAPGKSYMAYSDAGQLLAALYARGSGRTFHGPSPVGRKRAG